MSSNPFGEAPPAKPNRTVRPPPANPFGAPSKQQSHDVGKAAKNPFGPSNNNAHSTPPVLSPIVPIQVPVAPAMPLVGSPELPAVPPPIPPELPPYSPTGAPPLPPPPLPPSMPPVETESIVTADAGPSTPMYSAPPPPLPADAPQMSPEFAMSPPPLPPVAPQLSSDFATPPPPLPAIAPQLSSDFATPPPPLPTVVPQLSSDFHVSNGFDFDAPAVTSNDGFGSIPAIPNAVPAQGHNFNDDEFAVSFAASQAPPPLVPPAAPSNDDFPIFASTAAPTAPAHISGLVAEPEPEPESEPNVHVLTAPPPQIDDDPYDMHVNKPVPVPVAPPTSNPRPAKHEDTQVKKPHKEGDPFGELVEPLKPKQAVNPFSNKPANPLDSLPLNALLAKQQQQQQSSSASDAATPLGYKFNIPVVTKAPVVPTNAPLPSAPVATDFDLFDNPSAAAPTARAPAPSVTPAVAPVAISSSDLDIFAAKPKPVTTSVEPFATTPFDPFESSTTATADSVDDSFDVFGIPRPSAGSTAATTKATKPGKGIAPPPPVINKANATATKSSTKPTPIAPMETSHPLEHRKSNTHGFDHAMEDPFGAPAPHSDDEDDIFGIGTSSTSQNHHENPFDQSDDPLARLKQSYGLTSNVHDNDHTADAFDDFDDFTFDQAKHGHSMNNATRSKSGAATSQPASSIQDPAEGEEGLQADGDILSRLSAKAMFTKDWHETYYVIRRDTLYVFRQRGDYHLFLAQLKNRRERRGSAGDNQPPLYKKCFPLVYNIKLEPIKSKEYKSLGMVYNFSLELLEDFGLNHLGKFGSTDRESVQKLWNHIRDIVMEKRKEKVSPQQRYG